MKSIFLKKRVNFFFILIPISSLFLQVDAIFPQTDSPLPEKGTTMAVLPFTNNTNDKRWDYLQDSISEFLTTELGKWSGIILVERKNLKKVIGEMALTMTDMFDQERIQEVGQAIGADTIVVGSFNKIKSIFRVDGRMVRVSTTEILSTAQWRGVTEDIISEMPNKLAEKLMKGTFQEGKKSRKYYSLKSTVQAEKYLDQGLYDKAIEELEKSVNEQPEDPLTYFLLGKAYANKKGWHPYAIKMLKKAIKLDHEYEEAYLALASIYIFEEQQHLEAIKCLNLAIKINENNERAHNLLGILYRAQKKYSSSVKELRLAIKLNQEFAGARNNLGTTYMEMNDYQKALKLFKIAIKLQPSNASYHRSIAECYEKLDMEDEALREWERSVELEPEGAAAEYARRHIRRLKGK